MDIEWQNLTKAFGRVLAVDKLTFSVPAGQITGFLGPNGAGKHHKPDLHQLLSEVAQTVDRVIIVSDGRSRIRRALGDVGGYRPTWRTPSSG